MAQGILKGLSGMPKVLPLISEDFVRRAVLPDGRNDVIHRDRKLTGFQLRLRRKAGGNVSRSYQVEYEAPAGAGSRKRLVAVIGDASVFTAVQARVEATEMLRAVERGDDPKAIKRGKIEAPTWEALVEDFDSDHIADKAPGSRKDYRGRIRRNLTPFFKGMKVADITSDSVASFKRKKRANPIDANRSIAVLSIMMNFAKARGWRSGDNPCEAVKRNREQPREDWLDEIDLPKFLAALQARDGSDVHELVRFLLISGWRVSEARLLRWEELDLPRLAARIETKTGPQVRQLSSDAAVVIDRQKHRLGFVFSGRSGRDPIAYARVLEALADLCREAGIKRVTPHVLRHSAATWAAVNGAELLELRQAFGWSGLAMPNRYVSKAAALGRQGAQKAADAMNVLGKPTAEIRQIK